MALGATNQTGICMLKLGSLNISAYQSKVFHLDTCVPTSLLKMSRTGYTTMLCIISLSLFLSLISDCGSLYFLHLLKEEAYLIMASQSTDL